MRPLVISSLLLLFFACNTEPASNWKELDLLSHGIPFSINAPDSVNVDVKDFGTIVKDVTIKNGKDYYVQIFASDARNDDLETVKKEQLNEVKSNPYFSRIVKDMPSGFIYESKIDSANINYGFKYIKLQGSKEYLISNGLIGSFSEEEISKMYESVSKTPIK